jgi:hypothetical protein
VRDAIYPNGLRTLQLNMDLMKPIAILLFAVISTSAHAASFEERVRIGRDIGKMEAYQQYQKTMYESIANHLTNTLKRCFDTIRNPETVAFTLIADITSEGVARSIETWPETDLARCFARGFGEASFPQPPVVPNLGGFPIVIDLNINQ